MAILLAAAPASAQQPTPLFNPYASPGAPPAASSPGGSTQSPIEGQPLPPEAVPGASPAESPPAESPPAENTPAENTPSESPPAEAAPAAGAPPESAPPAAAPAPSAATPPAGHVFCGQPVAAQPADPAAAPERYRKFVGIFSDADWTPQLCAALIVENVTVDGTATITYVFGPIAAAARVAGGVLHGTGIIKDGSLLFQNSDGSQYAFTPFYTDLAGRWTTAKGQTYEAIFKRSY